MIRARFLGSFALLLGSMCAVYGATFGTAVAISGGGSDLVLDEGRAQLYVVNQPQNRIEVYSISQRRFLNTVPTGSLPISAALSRTGKYLYVTVYNASALEVIDLDSLSVSRRVSLPAAPEGVAVGADDRVLISTIGTGSSGANSLLIYDPNAPGNSLASVVLTPPAPMSPELPPPSARIYNSSRSRLLASRDGRLIVGVNNPTSSTRAVFVYEAASGTVLRSRSVSSTSSVLSISPDGSKFMAGLTLFETDTLAVLAQQNAANASYPFPQNVNFNTRQNQGGSVFAPDGSALYSAFNIVPVQEPAARANVSQLIRSDPDNLLIQLALQVPENLTGKLVIASDSANIYGLSESGFLILPVSEINRRPIAALSASTVLLANDQCGVTADSRSSSVRVRNEGEGRLTASAQLRTATGVTATPGLGGAGGAGGGAPGGGFVIVPPGTDLPVELPAQPGGTGQAALTSTQQTGIAQTAPRLVTRLTESGTVFEFSFNSVNARSLGTVAPHEYLIQSQEAINIPSLLRVYQNNRNAEASGDLIPVPTGVSATEGLVDLVADPARQRLYVANSGLNRVEVFDTRRKQFLSPIKVGQLPRSLALSLDGNTLYVANTGGESISIIDLDKGEVTGRVQFPPLPFNASASIMTPRLIAATQRGLQVIASDASNGSLWRVIGNRALPRGVSVVIGADSQGRPQTIPAPFSMATTPNGEFAILLDGSGYAYLYDASSDEYVLKKQIFSSPIQGYYGPLAAGPRGQYFLANGMVLNQSLTPVASVGSVGVEVGPDTLPLPPGGGVPPGTTVVTTSRPVAAVAAVNANTFARFIQPIRSTASAVVSETPTVELVDTTTGATRGLSAALEGPLATQTGTQRVNVSGRTMAVDSTGTAAYILTTSGLSIVPMEAASVAGRPQVNQNGVVNIASYQPNLASGSLVSIFGRNLAASATAPAPPLPTLLGGACVTLNNQALPLVLASPEQVNVQIPPELAAGRYPLVVRSADKKAASPAQSVSVSKYAPAVFVDPQTGQAAIYHQDGAPVTKARPAKREERLVLFASGLGPTKGGKVVAGQPAPSDPLAVTEMVSVFFGDPRYKEAGIIVEWSGLTPGLVGVYQVNLRVPGAHIKGDKLLVTVRVAGVDSPSSGSVLPFVAVE